jgi:hypothetical protein
VIAGASSIRIDVDRERHDIVARVQQRGRRDLAVLALDRGDLTPATFAARSRDVVEGNVIAVAGFVEHDELIGVVGQEPRLLFPGTISSRPENGAYLELENVHIEEGLSGGPVFDPDTGDVLGIVTSRTSDDRGGFADSAALVVEPFLAASAIGFRERQPVRVAVAPSPSPRASAAPSPKASPAPLALRPKAPVIVTPRPRPPSVPVALHEPSPAPAPDAPRAWEAQDANAHRLVYDHNGCAIALSLAVQHLGFSVPAAVDDGAPELNAKLTLRIGRRVAPVAACADVAESEPSEATYEPAATSFDGHHVTIRFRYVAGPDPSAADAALFPSDVSVDADVDAAPVTAHVQLMDADWDGTFDVIASKDR